MSNWVYEADLFNISPSKSPEKGIAQITKNPLGFLPVVHDNRRRAEGNALYSA